MFEKVKEIIMEAVSCNGEDIVMEAKLKEDLSLDSLDAVELSMALEEAFDVTIEAEEMAEFVTVKDIVDYLEKKQQ